MLAASRKAFKKGQRSHLRPILPLVPEREMFSEVEDQVKNQFITMELKSKAGDKDSNSQTYKKYVKKFDEGSCQDFIDFLEDIEEVWRQNSMTDPKDKLGVVRAVLKGESRVAFDASLSDQTDQESKAVTNDMVDKAIKAVGATVFPHRALETQKRWMTRAMTKPKDMSIRKTISAIGRVNKALPKFPNATADSSFKESEVIELIEMAVPETWRGLLDLKGFIPSEHTKQELTRELEIIERNHVDDSRESQSGANNKRHETKKGQNKKKFNKTKFKYYCSKHGHNHTHDSKHCWDLNPELRPNGFKKPGSNDAGPKKFSKKTFQKELNLMSKATGSKADVIAQMEKTLKEEKTKLLNSSKRKAAKSAVESEDDQSVDAMDMDQPIPKKKKVKTKSILKKKPEVEVLDEEEEFLKKVRYTEPSSGSENSEDE